MPKYLTVSEAAERVRKSSGTIKKYIQEKRLTGVPSGNEWLVTAKSVAEFLGESYSEEGAAIVAVANQKGGVGKTTTSVNFATALAQQKRRVLLIDLDPQGGCSGCLGINSDVLEETIYDALMTAGFDIRRTIHKVYGIDFVPANADLSGAELELAKTLIQHGALQRALMPIRDDYDFIVIDTGPTLGMLTLNALTAAQYVLIPMSCEVMAARGLIRLFDTINRVQNELNPALEVMGVLPTMYVKRETMSEQVYTQLAAFCQKRNIRLFASCIPRRADVKNASGAKMPVVLRSPQSDASEAYMVVAQEVIALV